MKVSLCVSASSEVVTDSNLRLCSAAKSKIPPFPNVMCHRDMFAADAPAVSQRLLNRSVQKAKTKHVTH